VIRQSSSTPGGELPLERGVPKFPFEFLMGSDRAFGRHGTLNSAPAFFSAGKIHTSQICAPLS